MYRIDAIHDDKEVMFIAMSQQDLCDLLQDLTFHGIYVNRTIYSIEFPIIEVEKAMRARSILDTMMSEAHGAHGSH